MKVYEKIQGNSPESQIFALFDESFIGLNK